MDLTIHAYGYSELIFYVLQGLAMFRELKFYPTIINTMVLGVGIFYAWQMSAARAEGQWRQYLLKCIGMIVFVNALLLPKTTMFVKDHVEKSFRKVDNIPLAFALPIGIVENFGHLLTMGFDQAFTLVGGRSSLLYYHYGTVFGARLAREVLEAKIRDPEVVGNMREFIKRCVILPASIGQKFTKEELALTTNIWELVSEKAGDLARVSMIINRQRHDPTCHEAVGYFEEKFAAQEGGILNQLAKKFRGAGQDAEYNEGIRQFNKSINVAIHALYNGEHKVDAILKNNMMINAINGYRSGKYANARAQMHQESGGLLSGDLGEKTLTGSLTVMKVIVYSGFIFLLPLLILAGGFAKYKSWIIMVFSLSLWPPLFSILNLIIDFAYEPAKVVSYSSWSTEMQKFDSIASLAAGLTMSIPFLAYYMTRLGEGGFTQLAGTIMASANAATSSIAGERSSGSRNWDNDSINNNSRNNSNANKTNHNMEYFTGENSWNLGDGSVAKTTFGGGAIISGGQGRTSSSGDASYRIEDGVQNVLQEGRTEQLSLADSDTRSLAISKANTISKQAAMLKTIMESTRATGGKSIENSTEEGKIVNQMLSRVDAVNKTNNHGYEQNARTVLSSDAGVGWNLNLGLFKVNVGVSTSGSISADNNSSQSNGESISVSRDNSTNQSYNNITRALNNDSWTKEHGVTEDMSKGYHESYEKMQRAEKQLSQRYENIETYNQALNYSKTDGASTGKDMYQEVLETYARESGQSIFDARKDVEARTPEVRKVFDRLVQGEANHILEQIHAGKSNLSKEAVETTLNDTSKNYEQNINPNIGTYVNQAATESGFNQEEIKDNINKKEERNSQQFTEMQAKSDNKYKDTKGVNQLEEKVLKATIAEHEADRIGKGDIGTLFGAIDGVGRPKDTKSFVNYSNSNGTYNAAPKGQEDVLDISDYFDGVINPYWNHYSGGVAPSSKPESTEAKAVQGAKVSNVGNNKLQTGIDGQKVEKK